MNKIKLSVESSNQQKMNMLQKWSFLASNASLPWTVLIGVLISIGPINGIYQTINNLQENYKNRTQRIVDGVTNTTYKCGEGFPGEYICNKITELVERGNIESSFYIGENNEDNIEQIEEIKVKLKKFLEEYPDNLNGELILTSGIKDLDLNNPNSITDLTIKKDTQASMIVTELKKSIPALGNSLKARGVQEYLSEEEKNNFLEDLKKVGYNGDFDIDEITNFFLYNNGKYNEYELENLYHKLFLIHFGKSNIVLKGEKINQVFEENPLYSELLLFILGLLTTLAYASSVLPFSGINKISTLLIRDYNKIINGVNSKKELDEINKIRDGLGYQSYSDSVKMFNMLGNFKNGKVIKIKGSNFHKIHKNDGSYYYTNSFNKKTTKMEGVNDNLILLFILENYGFNINNTEIIDIE